MVDGLKIYSCYCPPSLSHQKYIDFLARLQLSLTSLNSEVLLIGDVNAHHPNWRSRKSNKRGEALSDLINAQSFIICNTGQNPTFQNKNRPNHRPDYRYSIASGKNNGLGSYGHHFTERPQLYSIQD